MFTGLVEEIGTIKGIQKGANSAVLVIEGKEVLKGTKIGDSIAVNGICLTVTKLEANHFHVDVMHETLNRSTLGTLKVGSGVHLERAMAADGRFGGHMVAGHVDGVATIVEIKKDDNAIWYRFEAEEKLLRYVIEKGSVALDGISLTVARVHENGFSISAIPHTVEKTLLSKRSVGDRMNLETDLVGKYVEKLLAPAKESKAESTITRDFLAKYGF